MLFQLSALMPEQYEPPGPVLYPDQATRLPLPQLELDQSAAAQLLHGNQEDKRVLQPRGVVLRPVQAQPQIQRFLAARRPRFAHKFARLAQH